MESRGQVVYTMLLPPHSLEGLKLKLQYFGHLMRRANSLERPWRWERLRAEGEGNNRGWDGWMVLPTQWTWAWANSGSWWWTGKPGVMDRETWRAAVYGVAKSRIWPSDGTAATLLCAFLAVGSYCLLNGLINIHSCLSRPDAQLPFWDLLSLPSWVSSRLLDPTLFLSLDFSFTLF